ncbi:head GIN domain-containing protein [Kordia sp.]|uniref:head GIN domain-containing protein n=1 Tax=Kordia sp. TaxID=1965332 RepID=UPI003D2A21D8
MKQLFILLFLIGYTATAQTKGNKKIVTKTFPLENIQKIKINFYAKVTIDQSAKEGMTITTDENMMDLIDKEVVGNTLYLDQKEWIQPSQKTIITIGAPNIRHVETGTHDVTKIVNVDNEYLQLTAPIGTIILEGKTKELRLGIELAKIDASNLIAENAFVNIWSWGTAKVNVTNTLHAEVSNSGKLIYVNSPKEIKQKTKNEGEILSLAEKDMVKNPNAEWIKFKIKNNNFNRNNFFVIGPKKDGTKFSYGFPMMPNALRKENWTVGTKIYKVNSLGLRKLLVTISKEDANTTVELF